MRHLFNILIIIFLISLCSCKFAATFDAPQPENEKSLASFPSNLLGSYSDSSHQSILTISNHLITRHFDYDYKESRETIDSSYSIIGDTLLINKLNGSKEEILIQDDSIVRHENLIDTLFNLSGDNLLKKYKGFYFLNVKYNELGWEVKKLSLEKGVLTIGSISDKEDLKKLEAITESPSDTIPIKLSLTKRQFKRFVKENGFSSQLTFTRMKGCDM